MEGKGRKRGREGGGGEGKGRGRGGGKELTWLKEISFRVSGPFSIFRCRGSRTVNMPATLCSPKYSLCMCRCVGVEVWRRVCVGVGYGIPILIN